MKKSLLSTVLSLLLGLFAITAFAQQFSVTSATPDANSDGLLTPNEFDRIMVFGSMLDTGSTATLEWIGTGQTCSPVVFAATETQLLLDVTGCSFYPSSGAFLVTVSDGTTSGSDSFTLTPENGPRNSNYLVGE